MSFNFYSFTSNQKNCKMKKLLIVIGCIVFNISVHAQETYTVDNATLELKTEVEGNLDLLWSIDDSKYRYFVRSKDGNIQELVNTKNPDSRKYQEEYKTVLKDLTSGYSLSTEKVNLTLFSLKEYINSYNSITDSNYVFESRSKLQVRIGVFGGITNQPLISNPNNISVPFFGAEFELFEANKLPRHALFFQARHALDDDEFQYTSTQLSIGYRYRVINKSAFSFYGNLKIVTFDIAKGTYNSPDPAIGSFTESTTALLVPFIVGLGADIKVTKNGYITLAYHDIYALFVDNSNNFPIDFAVGFKYNL